MNGLVLEAGAYRTQGVGILGAHGAVANHLKTAKRMQDLFHQPMPENFAEMAAFHAAFEKIHPFSDGNGRVGRLLVAACALQRGLVPPIIERERRAAYYHSLELAQTSGKYGPLIYLLARETVATATLVGVKKLS